MLRFTAFKHHASLFRIRKNVKTIKKWSQAKCVRNDSNFSWTGEIMPKLLKRFSLFMLISTVISNLHSAISMEIFLHQCKNWKKYWGI